MSSVTLKGIYKKYAGGVTAVSDFNLDIQDKEFIILVGPSGCGKSTTLRMIAGLEEISLGELYIDDKLVNDVPPKDRDIAMVFQNYALYPHMTVFENMSFGLKLRKMPKDEIKRRVNEAAQILEIEHLLDRKPAALSGGQRQRVALGRAIVRNPKVFLLDEPLSNLDAKLRTAMRSELSKLHRRLETTFIYVTHDQTEAMTMGTRIVVMKDGFIQQIAAPQDLYEHPANLFVATFIGTPQMNTCDGELSDEDGVTYLNFGEGCKVALPPEKGRTPEVMAYAGKKVIFGIRPNDIKADAETIAKYPDRVIDTTVDISELLGADTNLYLSNGEIQLTAVVSTGTVDCNMGDRIKVCIDTNKIHLFDCETEKAIIN
ncbi:MAG: sn-glycerol-3-phosphate ABC transporter ATP-binding protein UgpC [Oscillospiraceae bacterium]|nr:sn-glycerol-3-phosphate ABC transporter ATP-binding protein UgpC [Oscillospiraceae bacterium]